MTEDITYQSVKASLTTLLPEPREISRHRIVAKVDMLMALCDALESRLNARAGVQGRLTEGVGKQVAG